MVNTVITKGFKATGFAAAAFSAFTAFQVNADIVISGTRIVYPQSSKDVIVNLDNRGNKPLLVQTWLDDGRDGVDPQELKLPFVITPRYLVSIHKKDNPYALRIWVAHYLRIGNHCFGLTCWKSRQNQKRKKAKI